MSFFFGGDEKGATIAPTAHGLGLVAAQDLKAQDIVFSETPVLSARLSDAFATPAFLARPDVSKIVDALGAVEEKHGHEAEDEAYPEAAKTLIDDLSELHVLERVAKLDAAGAAKVWALEDAFREPRPGDAVAVEGLTSAAGAPLNGARGAVVGADGDRLAVELPGGRKSIKGAHLKTLRGVLKTFITGQQKRAKFPTSKAPISAVFHSIRLIFGRAIISRNGLEAWMLFLERARAEHSR